VSRRWAEACLALNTLLWGATFVLIKAALRDVSAVLFLALRFGLATAALGLVFRRSLTLRSDSARGGGWAAGAVTGVLLFAGFFFQTQGLRFTTPPKSAFLTGLTTVLVPLVGACVYRVRPQVFEVVGVLVATLGMGLMTLEWPIGSIGRGDALTLMGAVAFAGHIVMLGHYSAVVSYPVLSVAQVGAAAVSALLLLPVAEMPHIAWQPAVVWAILISGLLSTALAFTIQAWAQRYTTSTRTALIYALEPVVAWVTSFLVAGEGLAGHAAVGAALFLAGVMLVEVKRQDSTAHQKVSAPAEGI
jgi:drug/metabolite transporter (DMT)-like permease